MSKKTKIKDDKYLSKQLAKLSDKIAGDMETGSEFEKTHNLISHYINNGQDDILLKAIKKTKTDDGNDWLVETVMSNSESLVLPDYEDWEAILFAIPIVIEADFPTDLPSIDDLFVKHQLINSDQSLQLNLELLQIDDLGLPPSQRLEMLKRILSGDTITSEHPFKKERLYFIVGAVTCDNEPFDLNFLENWQREFQDRLLKQKGVNLALIGEPECFNESIFQGVNLHHEFDFKDTAVNAVLQAANNKSACLAVKSFHESDDESQIRIGFFDNKNEFIDGFVWPVLRRSDLNSIVDSITDIFKEACVDADVEIDYPIPLIDEDIFFPMPPRVINHVLH